MVSRSLPPEVYQLRQPAAKLFDLNQPFRQLSRGGGASAQLLEIGDVPDDLDQLDFKNMALGEDVLPPPTDLSSRVWGNSTS